MRPKKSTRAPRQAAPPADDTLGRRFSTAVVLYHSAIAARLGLNVTDWKCGEIVERLGPMNPGRLSELTGLSSAATTQVLDRLEASGFVARERDPGDRRKVIVRAVPDEARAARIASLFAPMNARLGAATKDYTPPQLEAIADFIARAAAVIEEEGLRLRLEPAGA